MERKPRPFINVRFKCCNTYRQVYLNKAGTAFIGHCPKCAARMEIRVGQGGSKSRFWEVG